MQNQEISARAVGQRRADRMICAGIDPDTGEPFYVDEKDAPLLMTWNEAVQFAEAQDKKLPTRSQLNVMFENRAKIGGFNETGSHPAGWYCSFTEGFGFVASNQNFSSGDQLWLDKSGRSAVRLVLS